MTRPVEMASAAPTDCGHTPCTDWREHGGGGNPVAADARVEIETRDGTRTTWERAEAVVWHWSAFIWETGDFIPASCQVVRYRILGGEA